MRTVKIERLISLSIDRTKLILFQPFSVKKWLCLLLIASLAGAMGSGNVKSGSNYKPPKKAEAVQTKQIIDKNNAKILLSQYDTRDALYREQMNEGYGDFEPEYSYPEPETYQRKPPSSSRITPVMVMFFVFLILPLILLFAWIGARFQFIWFDSITKNDASIAAPFKQHRDKGNSLFEFYLIIILTTIAFFIFIAFWTFKAAKASGIFGSGWSFQGIFGSFLPPVLIGIAAIIFLLLLHTAISHFVVTIMAIDNCLFKPAWDKFMKLFQTNQKEFWFYVLVLIVLSIVCWIIVLVTALICLLAILLVGGILFGIPYLIFKMGAIFIAFVIIVGIPFLAIVALILMSLGLPIAVFFRSFSLYFLSSIECDYNPLDINRASPPPRSPPAS